MRIPRLVIAGVHSGAGKTTVAVALMAAFRRQGLAVQPFKVGPDYIDPAFHTRVTGRVSRNLDSWMLPESAVQQLFLKQSLREGVEEEGPPVGGKDAPPAVINLIEGVMGLFDGQGSGHAGSTAHVAELLDAPVILIVDGRGFSRSAAALVRGYRDFSPRLRLAGVILNRVSARHYALLRGIIEGEANTPCFGYLPRDQDVELPERHLGLVPDAELADCDARLSRLADLAAQTLDLPGLAACAGQVGSVVVDEAIQEIAMGAQTSAAKDNGLLSFCDMKRSSFFVHYWHPYPREGGTSAAPAVRPIPVAMRKGFVPLPRGLHPSTPFSPSHGPAANHRMPRLRLYPAGPCAGEGALATGNEQRSKTEINQRFPRLGVARDTAFSFSYQDNLDFLEECGAELVFFSPLRDAALPENLDGLYLVGGFPEIFAQELADNTSMRRSTAEALEAGLPAYAECGGLMYLCASLTDAAGGIWPMCGFFPEQAVMTSSLQRFGYVEVSCSEPCILGPAGTVFRAHEFHHSRLAPVEGKTTPTVFQVRKPGGAEWRCGLRKKNVVAGYPHLHFHANPAVAEYFLHTCADFQMKEFPCPQKP